MAELARDFFRLEATVEIDWTVASAVQHVLEGRLVLVPYDCSSNNEPALYEGEKSHWAVIVGIACRDLDGREGCTVRKIPMAGSGGGGGDDDGLDADDFRQFVRKLDMASVESFVCVQPKSKRAGAWSCTDLHASNANLVHCNTRRDEGDKIVPLDLRDTLARRIVVLSKRE